MRTYQVRGASRTDLSLKPLSRQVTKKGGQSDKKQTELGYFSKSYTV